MALATEPNPSDGFISLLKRATIMAELDQLKIDWPASVKASGSDFTPRGPREGSDEDADKTEDRMEGE
ncbi:uncharacterized protein PGTG_22059 [Puccinia graminis f. sp. tritici CRL 75-36-700-3]|uniref:Uncharacterized protein n=1 Tax=Puccinia graminis f. sp. tritici (strain CRL 75-36-700-3 / race SCCL) TaxID=418459 RepID=H6QTM2_PUCGT|nr:uncharacterized protein PGTG_22059 [Puccinia graminis f. sp. tritici CRL 75-36-700-3]EHS64233.1 hypothetical protein PGTG_22059 [Puccinia graminis f. sp. tritici CRL 75-36-700-3]